MIELLNNELKSEYRNDSLDCLSDMTLERTEPVFLLMHGVLENQIQGLSRTFIHRFKDFPGHVHFQGLSRPIKSENKIQGLSKTGTCPRELFPSQNTNCLFPHRGEYQLPTGRCVLYKLRNRFVLISEKF